MSRNTTNHFKQGESAYKVDIVNKAGYSFKTRSDDLKSEDLGLSDDQIAKIKALKLDVKKELIQQNADIDIPGIDIKAEMYADTIDVDAINKLISKKYDLKKAKAQYLVTKYAQLKNILTAEQKDKLKDIWKQCKKK